MVDYDNVREWWDNQAKSNPAEAGTAGIAGGGEIELVYRHYMEWRHFRKLIKLKKDMAVLEMGCGGGRWALAIAPHVKRVIAIDVSPEMIRLAGEKQRAKGIQNVEFSVQSIQDFSTNLKFDVIYFSGVLQFLTDEDMTQVLKSASGMLRPGGVIIDRSTSHEPDRELYEQGTYQSVYRTVAEIRALYADAGFELNYHASSYRLMRLVWLVRMKRIGKFLEGLNRVFYPLSCYGVNMATWILDKLMPIPSQQGPGRKHEFFRFTQC